MSERPTHDVYGACRRMIRALGQRVANGEAEELRYFQRLAADIDHELAEAVAGLRSHGILDGEIAQALGVTRQAVSQRWPDHGARRGAAARYPTGGAR